MEETGNPQRLLLAVVLSIAVLLAWNYFFHPTKKAQQPGEAIATKTATAAETPGPSIEPTRAATTAAAYRAAEPEIYEFHGAVTNEKGEKQPYRLELTNVGGAVEYFELSNYFERDKSNQKTDRPIKLAERVAESGDLKKQMFGLSFAEGSTVRLPERAVYEVVEKNDDTIRYRLLTSDNTEIEREYRLTKDAFAIEFAITIRNRSSKDQRHALQVQAALEKTEAMSGYQNAARYFDAKTTPYLQSLIQAKIKELSAAH